MTKARVGSQSPAKSRNPSTLAGFIMPEIARPAPNSAPIRRLVRIGAIASASYQMADDVYRDDSNAEECRRRCERARGPPRQSANPVAAGAAAAEPGAEADQQAACDQHRPPSLNID